MDIRAAIRKLPPAYTAAAAGVLVLLMGWNIYRAVRRPTPPGMSQTRVLRCANCGHVTSASQTRIAREVTVDAGDMAWPAMRCPECGGDTLRLARQCPRDGEVFAWYAVGPARDAKRAEAKCPRCGWDPAAEELERLKKITSAK